MRVRFLNRDFQNKLDLRDRAWCESFPSRVSQNASYFFGETKFDSNPVGRILQLLDANPGRELECFDWHFGRRSDGEKSLLCTTISAYFRSVQAIREILYGLVDSDGRAAEGRRPMHTSDLLDLLTPCPWGWRKPGCRNWGPCFRSWPTGSLTSPTVPPIWAGPPVGFSWT